MRTKDMLKNHPYPTWDQSLVDCVEACFDCAQACTSCADACLSEDDPSMLARCIRLNLDCADSCSATGRILSRQTGTDSDLIESQIKACMEACRICAQECEKHAPKMAHCKICMESCLSTEKACAKLIEACRQRQPGDAMAPEECA
jgi:hypothetical protein